MNRLMLFLLVVLAVAAGSHYLLIRGIPEYGMGKVFEDADKNNQWNRITHGDPVDAYHQIVITSSPDLIYSLCRYDLSSGPVEISAAVPSGYWSWSFYDAQTNNYATFNDQSRLDDNVTLVLIHGGQSVAASPGKTVIASPTLRGAAMYRISVADAASREALLAWQQKADCQPLNATPDTTESEPVEPPATPITESDNQPPQPAPEETSE